MGNIVTGENVKLLSLEMELLENIDLDLEKIVLVGEDIEGKPRNKNAFLYTYCAIRLRTCLAFSEL